MLYTINVTELDITNGLACVDTRCPIALACIRAGMEKPSVCLTFVSYEHKDSVYSIMFPTVARAFIKRFDSKLPVEPIQFVLDSECPYGPEN